MSCIFIMFLDSRQKKRKLPCVKKIVLVCCEQVVDTQSSELGGSF